ncbi:MAG TPA: glycosyltransferase family 4 protein [Terriglobales bacterium]|nr:glycosyltransferase family 4 protein [Terriglobales bacterium]
MPRLLVFNCHEAWVHQLRLLHVPLDIIVDLPGRHIRGWDESIRPLPPLARLVKLEQVLALRESYDCIITHNLTDLLDVKSLPGPRLLVIHLTLDGMILEQHSRTDPAEFRHAVHRYIESTATHVVAVSKLKGSSWGFPDHIVPLSVDPSDYIPWQGELASGLRISNFILRRPQTLLWDFHQAAFSDLPVTLVGRNPELPAVQPSRDWSELKQILQRHRFFIHTAHPLLEDGYNTATLEAMAAGLPILGNRHPTSPIEHGVSGFLSDDPAELRSFALRLLEDRPLAQRMGQAAQATVRARFSPASFRDAMLSALHAARQKAMVPRPGN